MSDSLTLLAISDLHHTGFSRQTAQPLAARGELSRILLSKIFLRLQHLGIRPDLTVVLGDLVAEGTDRNAEHDLIAIHSELTKSQIPFLVIPGNHDAGAPGFKDLFDVSPGLHRVKSYGLIVYDDAFAENHETARTDAILSKTKKIAEDHPGLPLIALQHAPIYPAITSHSPYRPTNVSDIIESFQKSGIFLSLSGHYHKGQKLRLNENIYYHTVPALCEEPFSFSLIHITGKKVEVEEMSLAFQFPNITDVHCHTEHAYCATTVDTASAILLSKLLGVSRHCVAEHAFQLYFEKKYAMSGKWQSNPQSAEAVWSTPLRSRMVAYRRFAEKLRSKFVKIALEVDLYDNGKLLLAPEDLDEGAWDILIGAIHYMQGFVPGTTSQKEAEDLFLRDVDRLVHHPIKVLAHPFRFFAWNRLETPKHLYPVVADMLADTGVAAEVNFHAYETDPDFIRCCAEKHVKIALASDAHALSEVGEFLPHVNVLKQAGIMPKMFPKVLFSF